MAVDKNGFISLSNFSGFQSTFSHLVSDTVQKLVAAVPELIHSIYVYGSHAEGRAVETQSDLDLTVIFSREQNTSASQRLSDAKYALEREYPVISKIDIDPGVQDTVMLPENAERWGYWLKHHCVCVYGDDLRERFEPFRPSREIAIAVNGDF